MDIPEITQQGITRARATSYADELLALKKSSVGHENNGVWEVIGRIVSIWKESFPTQWDSYLIDLGKIKASRADEVFGKSKDTIRYKGDHGSIRYTADVPQIVYMMIRGVYNDEELPMNREFWQQFAKHFPIFRVAQKQ